LAHGLRKPFCNSYRDRAESSHVPECRTDMGYDEDAFLYFLDIERARAGRGHQPLHMLFATLEPEPGKPVPIPASSADRLFEGMKLTLRDTDVLGWYRQGRVASAVLSARPDGQATDMTGQLEQRVGDGLRRHVPKKIANSLRVRVVQLGPRQVATA
jgi:hypothetical protein